MDRFYCTILTLKFQTHKTLNSLNAEQFFMLLSYADFFSKFFKNSFSNTFRVSIGLDPDKD